MPQIRQEVAMYNECVTADSSGFLHLDTNDYDGTVTYYFEATNHSGGACDVILRRKGTSTDDATLSFPGVQYEILGTSFTPPAGATDYVIREATSSFGDFYCRIIVTQSGSFTKTKTQIDMTSNSGLGPEIISTTLTAFCPQFCWKYVAANYDGTKVFEWAVIRKVDNAANTGNVELQTSSDLGANWTTVNSVNTTSTTPVRTVTAFTPVDGNLYQMFGKVTAGTVTAYNFQIIITQTASPTKFELQYVLHTSILIMGKIGVINWNAADWSGVTNTYRHAAAVISGATGDVISLRSPKGAGGTTVPGSTLTDNQTTVYMISGPLTMPANGTIDFNYSSAVNDVIVDSRILVAVVATAAGGGPIKSSGRLQAVNRAAVY